MTHPRATNDKYAGLHDTADGLLLVRYVGRAEATICRHAHHGPRAAGWYYSHNSQILVGPFSSSLAAYRNFKGA